MAKKTAEKKELTEEKSNDLDFDLIGMDAIAQYVNVSYVTILAWREKFGFPIHQLQKRSIWCARKADIDAWRVEQAKKTTNDRKDRRRFTNK